MRFCKADGVLRRELAHRSVRVCPHVPDTTSSFQSSGLPGPPLTSGWWSRVALWGDPPVGQHLLSTDWQVSRDLSFPPSGQEQ